MNEQYQDFPPISQELIDALEERFPDKMTDLTDLNVICHLQGQVSVVRLLKHVQKVQSENILSTTIIES
jgi:hypothetical protein